MKVLLTGGAGFVGSHLCDFLIDQGHSVICLDNLVTGSLENIKQHKKNKRFQFIKHDISRPIKIKGKIDAILHFASPASPIDYAKLPIQTLKVGSLGTLNALELAKAKSARFIMASTSEIYGDPLVSPQKESYWGNVSSIGPRSCYDEAKRFSEALVMAYHRTHGVNTGIVRIFNTYGPRMRKNDGRVVPNFINQAIKGQPLTIYGRGKQTRSFCYVSDLVRGIYKLMKSDLCDPVNLGNPDEFTIIDFAKLVKKMIKSKSKFVYQPLPQDDPKQRKPNIDKAMKVLHWQPKVKLAEGLLPVIKWFRDA